MSEKKSIHCTLTDYELAAKAGQWIDELIASGGKSWTMQVPARPNADTDLIFTELINRFKKLIGNPKPGAPLTPGPPTTTGTYFAVIKCYVSDEPQMCVLHYQAHKNVYRAVGHAFNVEIKAEDIVGYVGEIKEPGVMCEPDFIAFIKNEREAITKAMYADEWWLEIPAAKRVVVENLLIAYDQMVSRLREANRPGAEWVKASAPPNHERYIPIRFSDGTYKVAAFTTDHMLKERQPFWMYSRHDQVNTLLEFEWYNESESPAAGREEDAVLFADWIREQNYKPYAGSWFLNGNNYAHQPHSTRNLYELFKQQKEK